MSFVFAPHIPFPILHNKRKQGKTFCHPSFLAAHLLPLHSHHNSTVQRTQHIHFCLSSLHDPWLDLSPRRGGTILPWGLSSPPLLLIRLSLCRFRRRFHKTDLFVKIYIFAIRIDSPLLLRFKIFQKIK